MLRRLLVGSVFAATTLGLTGSLPGQNPAGEVMPKDVKELVKKLTDVDTDTDEKKYPEFAKVVKGAKVTDGLLTLHQKDDHLYAELQP